LTFHPAIRHCRKNFPKLFLSPALSSYREYMHYSFKLSGYMINGRFNSIPFIAHGYSRNISGAATRAFIRSFRRFAVFFGSHFFNIADFRKRKYLIALSAFHRGSHRAAATGAFGLVDVLNPALFGEITLCR
jgi:hypothetical protein